MAVLLGQFTGTFLISLLLATVWLIICKAIPPMRRKVGLSYGIAIVFAFIPPLITLEGPTHINLIAALLCAGLLFWQYRRAKAKIEQRSTATENDRSKR